MTERATNRYDVAAYVWPAYSDAPEMRWAFPERMGEWERIRQAQPKFEGHRAVHEPLWGYVNEADPYVMEMQIDAAADHSVNVFLYDWYWYDRRPFLEGCLNEGYLRARNNDRVKFYLMWANHDVKYAWDIRNSYDHNTVLYGRGLLRELPAAQPAIQRTSPEPCAEQVWEQTWERSVGVCLTSWVHATACRRCA